MVIDRTQVLKEATGSPIVILNDPTYSQLFGKIDHVAQFGSYSTNLTLIHKGALHEANGGYLLVNARPLLETPILWHQIKKIIKSGTIPFNFDNTASGIGIISLEPEPIPFNDKSALLYAEIATSVVNKESLLPLNKFALAKLVEIGARHANSQNHLTTNISFLIDIIREANYVARGNKQNEIDLPDISTAFNFRKRLRSRIPSYMQDMIKK